MCAQVSYRSARLWARFGIALRRRRAGGADRDRLRRPRVKGSSGPLGVTGRKRRRVGCQGHWWPSGRSGAGWGLSQGLPCAGWEAASVALCGARGGDLRPDDYTFPRLSPLGCKSAPQKFGLEGWGC
jgi:hypothetical protein